MNSKSLTQYRHAEIESRAADPLEGDFGHVLVVPAYGELQSLFDMLGSVPQGSLSSSLVGPSLRRPPSKSARQTQLRIVWAGQQELN